ncbi:16307_t:CDS:2 [Cetraspora pellucida]|uniref:Long-chain-alcohol oxidase n=1 Tax=Cetraspora pellucida TaxID=1433469 RepID=A0A9N9E614_9GLOM|nr:16307_t:CDS:2 [Cetraspora pellucida]
MTDEKNSLYGGSQSSDAKSIDIYDENLHLAEKQKKIFLAICGVFISELNGKEFDVYMNTKTYTNVPKNANNIKEFGQINFESKDDFSARLFDRLQKTTHPHQFARISSMLKKMCSKMTSYSMTNSPTKLFYELSLEQRAAAVAKWSTSQKASIRQFYRTISYVARTAFWLNPYGIYPAIGYPGPDPEKNGPRFKGRTFPEYEFIKITEDTNDLEFDVVIIGSGAGGSVAAARNSVLVIEKGHHYHQSQLTLREKDGYEKLYELGGGMLSEDSSMTVLAGSNFGGGTTVSWSTSVEPSHFVREEWANDYGLIHFMDDDFVDSIKNIKNRLGVSSSNVIHNENNKILIEGCKKLGAPVATVSQNSASKLHECGWCGFGCRYGEKQGAAMTYLKDAKDYDVKFIQDCFVKRVIIENNKAVGVEATINNGDKKFKVNAKKVIVACGALHSPALLLRSGLKDKNIGKNLYTNPMAAVYGIFPNKEVKAYSGTIQSAVCDAKENVDGEYHGVKIVVGSCHPAMMSTSFPWKSPLQHKQFMLQYNHIVPLLIIARDRDPGQIKIDSKGLPKLDYKLSPHDAESVIAGILTSLKILVAAGATKIGTCQTEVEEFEIVGENSLNDPKFLQYLEKVKKVGVSNGQACLGSIYQMGTCRMGSDKAKSVVNPFGETWDVKNLYVADSSVFPTSAGASPMITTMSIGFYVANCILSEKEFVKKRQSAMLGTPNSTFTDNTNADKRSSRRRSLLSSFGSKRFSMSN